MHLHIQNQVGKKWLFTTIDASPNDVNRIVLWEDLKRLAENVQGVVDTSGGFQ